MTRNSLHTAIAVALIGTLALVGCKKKDETAAIPPPAAEPAPAPAPMPTEPAPAPAATATTVTMVDLGNAIGADNRVTAPSTTSAKPKLRSRETSSERRARRLETPRAIMQSVLSSCGLSFLRRLPDTVPWTGWS